MLRCLLLLFFAIQVQCFYEDIDSWYSNNDGALSAKVQLQPRKVYNSTMFFGSLIPRNPNVKIEFDTRRILFFDAGHEQDYSHKPKPYAHDGSGLFDLSRPAFHPHHLSQPRNFSGLYKCVEGQIKKVDECNKCLCIAGQLYMCTYVPECYDIKATTMGRVITASIVSSNKGPSCDEGEEIPGLRRCSQCKCIEGQIQCTLSDCQQEEPAPCKLEGKVPLPDNCNFCDCHDGTTYCTTKICIPGMTEKVARTEPEPTVEYNDDAEENSDVEVFQELNPKTKLIETKKAKNSCTPGEWYRISKSSDPHCKECLCIDGQTGFCFLELCKNSGQCIPGEKFSTGTPGSCHICECTDGTWQCYTEPENCRFYYDNPECKHGETTRSKLSACGACYCTKTGQHVCGTDEACAVKLLTVNNVISKLFRVN